MLPILTIDWDDVKDRGPGVLLIVALLLLAFIIFRAVFPRLTRAAITRGARFADEETARRADTIIAVVERSFGIALLIIGIVMVLDAMQLDVTAIITGLGITGLALALGAQALVKDAINGIFLLAEDQYRRGDVIKIAEVTGTVEDITLRRTIIRDVDGVVHSVPNGSINVVSNYTRDYAQVNVPVRVVYGEDLARVKAAVDRVSTELRSDKVYRDLITEGPEGGAVESVGEQGVVLIVTARARPAARWQVAGELRRRLAEEFLKEQIKVPFATTQGSPAEGKEQPPPSMAVPEEQPQPPTR